ncbi:fungal specific transcription factor domain-containing protein [Aspergillus vadensis CBS 113365]|uniref:Fungal-specific transcription factor domain protein n=1 Tax=Aspergillus vadensis (strain CBS 113365 / IMI 142717 / IBT 24658) TaxID=1448311 RepID=A0A319C0T9_ASPVC|nr:fungal-specific transcription factor domain protein [Aspergillus vadensis CBS 113365]PYH69058.1 fungal-specific transcription factor domain protein [Aspergillus vadensis CBS 113365]
MQYPPWPEQATFRISSTDSHNYSDVGNASHAVSAHRAEHISTSRKMAIPRLAEGLETFSTPGDKSGCRNCREAGIICCYTDEIGTPRQLASLEAKIRTYEDALRNLSNRFGLTNEQLMNLALTVEDSSSPTLSADGQTPFLGNQRPLSTPNSQLQPFVDSSHCVDCISEDFNKDEVSQATGYIGQSSEIAWIHSLGRDINGGTGYETPKEPISLQYADGSLISASNYHIDDQELPSIERQEPYALPSKDIASKLYNCYLDWVHPSFPIIGTTPFGAQFRAFFNNANLRPGNKWLAVLNVVFAIAARATVLSMDNGSFHHPDLQQLQVEGLTALYMLSLGHINRAWRICGGAVRGALGLGLHLRNMSKSASDTSREIRYRVWWSLYMLDHRLSMVTGRPSFIDDTIHTIPLPVPVDEENFERDEVINCLRLSHGTEGNGLTFDLKAKHSIATPKATGATASPPCGSLHFLHVILLTLISKKMTIKLYSPGAARTSWIGTEFAIQGLTSDIESWLLSLPKDYDFTSTQSSQVTHSISTHRMSLAFLFYSTKIGITRPCLRRPNPAEQEGKVSDEKMQDFCHRTAAECVESACHMLRLFPEGLDAVALYRMSPWWCILHFLVQATTVLLIELSFGVCHVPEKASMVSKATERALEWLAILAKTNAASEKARLLCQCLLRRIEQYAGVNLPFHPIPSDVGISVQSGPRPTGPSSTPDPPSSEFGSGPSPFLNPSNSLEAHVKCQPSPEIPGLMQTDKDTNAQDTYDEGLPYDPSTGQIIGSFFPPNLNLGLEISEYFLEEV